MLYYILVLEQRLETEKSETNKEQQRLHSLIAMLETQLSEKQRDIDKVGKMERRPAHTLLYVYVVLVAVRVTMPTSVPGTMAAVPGTVTAQGSTKRL